ncbi:cytochrome P450 [Salix suchowensis]|nr:cytochrome P450 [Salix suchowensis]
MKHLTVSWTYHMTPSPSTLDHSSTYTVLKRVQKEIDIHVGTTRWVEESDIKNLVYFQAIVKETLRLYPPGPLLVPRESLEDCYVGGYLVPRGTQLLVNAWKLHRDPRIWENPCEFGPERFLTSHGSIDVRGQQFEYVPFGAGRRQCPGISSSLQVLHWTLSRLLQGFSFSTAMNAQVDMSEGLGLITLPKATPLEVVLAPRLDHRMYQR